MKNNVAYYRLLMAACLMSPLLLSAQESTEEAESGDTKIIIIEERTDARGNKTVTKTIREGNFTDEEIKKIVEEESTFSEESAADVHADAEREVEQVVERDTRAYLGVTIEEREDGNVVIRSIANGSPADASGLRHGDVIHTFNGVEVTSTDHLIDIVTSQKAGDGVVIFYQRGEAVKRVDVELSTRASVNQHRDQQRAMAQERLRRERVERNHQNRRRLGVYIDHVADGVLVNRVSEGSIAENLEIQSGDILAAINGEAIESTNHLVRVLRSAEAGEELHLEILRDGTKVEKVFKFDE